MGKRLLDPSRVQRRNYIILIIELIEIEHVTRHGAYTARDATAHLFESGSFLTSASSPYLCYRSSLPPPSKNQGSPPPGITPYTVNGRYAQGKCSEDAGRLPIGEFIAAIEE